MTRFTISEARARLPGLVDRVQEGDEVVITRHGSAAAVLVRPDRLRARRIDDVVEGADRLAAALEKAREAPIPEKGLSVERAEELVTAVRRGRSRG